LDPAHLSRQVRNAWIGCIALACFAIVSELGPDSAIIAQAPEMNARNELEFFLKAHIGLTTGQIASIRRGEPVVKVLPSYTPAEITLIGAVHINAAPQEFLNLALDMNRLRQLKGYLGAGRLSDPPTLAELSGFTLEPEDIRSLKTCRPGNCDVQLPDDTIRTLQRTIDWSRPDAAARVNDVLRNLALDMLHQYRREGGSALDSYYDKKLPFDAHTELRLLLERSDVLPIYLPEGNRYLLEYPKATPEAFDSLFFWEKVDFGLKPTLRLNHAIAYRSKSRLGSTLVILTKQLYASHYFQLAVDLSACVSESERHSEKGFVLMTVKSSIQQGLTGFKGTLMRGAVVSRTHAAQEKGLMAIKQALETKPVR